MANIVRGTGNGNIARDPFALARELLGWDPLVRYDVPSRQAAQVATFMPTFNVVEREDGYHISADIPGVRDEDVDVTVQDGYLVVSGNRNQEQRKEGDNYYVYERRYGNFSRAFQLPDNANVDSVEASLKDGVLEIRIAKRESAKPRKVPLGQRLKDKLTGSEDEKKSAGK
jgi:HSP20 family protein